MSMNNRIVGRMLGGLGNQLFIYAYARYLQLNIKKSYSIHFDISSYKHNTFNSLDIIELPISSRFEVCNPRKKCERWLIVTSEVFRVLDFLSRKIFNKQIDNLGKKLRRLHFYYSRFGAHRFFGEPSRTLYLYGYFQNEFYLKYIENEIKKEAILPNNMLTDRAIDILRRIKSAENPVGISIRCLKGYERGGFQICTRDYYQKGIKYFKNKNKNISIFIFADDILTVKKTYNLTGDSVEYVENCSPCEQLTLMSYCKDFIIANSSFSWWGAFLGNADNKTIIVPKIWWQDISIEDFGLKTKHMVFIDD